jgi:hypothetical protein
MLARFAETVAPAISANSAVGAGMARETGESIGKELGTELFIADIGRWVDGGLYCGERFGDASSGAALLDRGLESALLLTLLAVEGLKAGELSMRPSSGLRSSEAASSSESLESPTLASATAVKGGDIASCTEPPLGRLSSCGCSFGEFIMLALEESDFLMELDKEVRKPPSERIRSKPVRKLLELLVLPGEPKLRILAFLTRFQISGRAPTTIPSSPHWPAPNVYNVPSSDIAALWKGPADIARGMARAPSAKAELLGSSIMTGNVK